MIDFNGWWERVLGAEWEDRSSGPDKYDCWGLVIDYYRQVKGVELPLFHSYEDSELNVCDGVIEAVRGKTFEFVNSKPNDGLFICRTGRRYTHVGIFRNGNCYHTMSGKNGVQCHRIRAIERMYKKKNIRYLTLCQ